MTHPSGWFTLTNDGLRVKSKVVYSDLYPEIVEKIEQDLPVSQIIGWIRQKTVTASVDEFSREPTTGALNNSCGRWNEFIATSFLCEIAVDLYQRNEQCLAILSLENSTVVTHQPGVETVKISSRFLQLFASEEFQPEKPLATIKNIRQKIFFPSPDYIVALLDADNPLIDSLQSLMQIQARNPGSLELYKLLRGTLKAHELKAVVSLKTSNRPDRRYQPAFEAAMIKSISHAAKQGWKYYMVISEVSPADQFLFENAISPHSIALGEETSLVDGVYSYRRKSDLLGLITAILS
jgi:Cfr10I/Bse634I restriction endonuclease